MAKSCASLDAMSSPSGLRVFFSYTSADRERVAPIVHALTQAGHTVWWDRHIAGGAAYAREIEAALEACQVVIVAWSKTSLESDWVRDEAAYGRDRKRLLPVRLDRVEPPSASGNTRPWTFQPGVLTPAIPPIMDC